MTNSNHSNYISMYNGIEVIDALETRISAIKKTLTIVSELDKWEHRYAEGKWTIKEIVQHCIDCERIFSFRALHIAREDQQILSFFDENLYVETSQANDRQPEELIQELISLMKVTYYQFTAFHDNVLYKKGHIEQHEISVEEIGYIIAGHSIHHMNIINERYL